jgi:beta-N-acetylhexosaminidase
MISSEIDKPERAQDHSFDALCAAPFFLDESDIEWVKQTMVSFTPEQRLSQLFNVQLFPNFDSLKEIERFNPGGVTLIGFNDAQQCKTIIDQLRASADIAPLFSADIEGGLTSGTLTRAFPNQLGCAAAGAPERYRTITALLAGELIGRLRRPLTSARHLEAQLSAHARTGARKKRSPN